MMNTNYHNVGVTWCFTKLFSDKPMLAIPWGEKRLPDWFRGISKTNNMGPASEYNDKQ